MSCLHGVWHAVDCEQCSAEATLWQRLAEANAVADAAMKEALARITRLEAENAEARELLKRAEDNVTNAELSDEITAFRAKGATP